MVLVCPNWSVDCKADGGAGAMRLVGIILACIFASVVALPAWAQVPTNNGCIPSETSDPRILPMLNANIGSLGGPKKRIKKIGAATPLPGEPFQAGRCQGTAVFIDGTSEEGLLLKDMVNGVPLWRWMSDRDLRPNSLARRRAQQSVYDSMRRDADANTGKIVHCGIEGPQSVYVANRVCYATISMFGDISASLKPYAGYNFLRECSELNTAQCMTLIAEMRFIASRAANTGRTAVLEQCASDLSRRSPGSEIHQYMNICGAMIRYFK